MTSYQTFETTGTIDENGVLQVAPFPGVPSGQVRVSVAVPQEEPIDYDLSDPTPDELTAMSFSTFADWADPAEDIYTWEDGNPGQHPDSQESNEA